MNSILMLDVQFSTRFLIYLTVYPASAAPLIWYPFHTAAFRGVLFVWNLAFGHCHFVLIGLFAGIPALLG